MSTKLDIAALIFFCTLLLTFSAALLARRHGRHEGGDEDLAGRKLNRWMVGLSAGTTGNSGFIVTGAVGLGYTGGVHWLLLPFSCLLGDLIFWSLFPGRINNYARKSGAITLPDMITHDLKGRIARVVGVIAALLIVVFLSGYASGQWLAGKKIMSGVFNISDVTATIIFAAMIVSYSSIGGFRGSVYTDFLQSFIRIFGTVVALGAVIWVAHQNTGQFLANVQAAGPQFLSLFPDPQIIPIIGFVIGFIALIIGFGLGSPQIVSRYMAGRDPKETQAARWIYIGFIYGTWTAMTIFGIILRGVMPGIADPETGLSVFFMQNMGAVITGVIIADIFATVASTANGLLVAITQTLQRNVIPVFFKARERKKLLRAEYISIAVGVATILLSISLPGNVYSIIISSLAMLGSGLGGAIMVRVMKWRHTGASLCAALMTGILSALAWKMSGFGDIMNEAAIGLSGSLAANYIVVRWMAKKD